MPTKSISLESLRFRSCTHKNRFVAFISSFFCLLSSLLKLWNTNKYDRMSLPMDWCWFPTTIQYSASIIPNRTKLIARTLSILCQDNCQFHSLTLKRSKNYRTSKQHVTGDKICDYLCNMSQDRATFVRYIHLGFSIETHFFVLIESAKRMATSNFLMVEIIRLSSTYFVLLLLIIHSQLSHQYSVIMNKITFSPKFEHHFQWKTLQNTVLAPNTRLKSIGLLAR